MSLASILVKINGLTDNGLNTAAEMRSLLNEMAYNYVPYSGATDNVTSNYVFHSNVPISTISSASDKVLVTKEWVNSQGFSGGIASLQEVTDVGNVTTNNIDVLSINGLPIGGVTGATSNIYLGELSLNSNTGSGVIGIGKESGEFNDGNAVNLMGISSGQYNSGFHTIGIGHMAAYYNAGASTVLIGSDAGRYNEGNNNVNIGYRSGYTFLENSAGAKDVTNALTDIDVALNRITISNHGFGNADDYVVLKYTTTGTAIGGIQAGFPKLFKVIDINTIECVDRDITSEGTDTHTFTPQFSYDNVVVIGANTDPTASNQVTLGDSAIVELVSGNYKFDVGQTLGATEDNYVLTYDDATGQARFEATAGGAPPSLQEVTDVGNTTTNDIIAKSYNSLYFYELVNQTISILGSQYWSISGTPEPTGNYGTFIGAASGTDFHGSYSVGIGSFALQEASGTDTVAIGSSALYKADTNTATALGKSAGSNSIADRIVAIGYNAADETLSDNITAIGYNSGVREVGSELTFLGYRTSAKVVNIAGAKDVANASTDVDVAQNRITIVSHGFGANGEKIVLYYTSTGTQIANASADKFYRFTVIDANTIEADFLNITTVGTDTHTFTPIFTYINSTALGANAQITASNQVVLGDSNVTELVSGNYKFNIGQTVGATEDNYVLTYDDATGQIGLEAAAAGGISDAPSDGTPYARQDASWVSIPITSITTPVENSYQDNTAMIADQLSQTSNYFQYVRGTDTYYEYLGTTVGDITDYREITDTDIINILRGKSFPAVHIVYANAAAMYADQKKQITGALYRTSDNDTHYEYLGTNNGDATDYKQIGNNPTGLELITEVNSGWRLIGADPTHYGNIGISAVDLSLGIDASSTRGATGNWSFATGQRTTASDFCSTAVGQYSVASGMWSFAGGLSSIASGNVSFSYGSDTQAIGSGAVAFGRNCIAGSYGLAIGDGSEASNDAIALGEQNNASAANSVAIGENLFARSNREVALGGYNTDYTPTFTDTDRALSIGIGDNTTNRVDGLIIFRNGLATLPTITNAMIDGEGTGKVIVTKEWINAQSFGGGISGIETQDEGSQILSGSTVLNFVGAGVTATDGGSNVTTITIPGSSVTGTATKIAYFDGGGNLTDDNFFYRSANLITVADTGFLGSTTVSGTGELMTTYGTDKLLVAAASSLGIRYWKSTTTQRTSLQFHDVLTADEIITVPNLTGTLALHRTNAQEGTSYTITAKDINGTITMDNASANTIDLPEQDGSYTEPIVIINKGSGVTTIQSSFGTINTALGGLTLNQYEKRTIYPNGNDWILTY